MSLYHIYLYYNFSKNTVAEKRKCFFAISAVFSCMHTSKYMVMSRDRNAGRGHSVKIDNSSIEKVDVFKYLGTM